MNEDFMFLVLSIVEEIPDGKVATYGQIASLSGYENKSRHVGKALSMSFMYGDFPCHRVVNHIGRLAPGWIEQKELLLRENITFKENGCVDLKKHQWEP